MLGTDSVTSSTVAVSTAAHQYIALPVHAELLMFVKPLNDNSRLHHVVLYIDGFIVKIQQRDYAFVDGTASDVTPSTCST